MRDHSGLIAVTTIQYDARATGAQKVRSEVFLDTAAQLQGLGIPCVAVEHQCSSQYLREVTDRGVQVVTQTEPGMSASRKEAMRAGLQNFPRARQLLWLEPEKPDLPRCALVLARRVARESAALGLFSRTTTSMATYPPEQAHYYLFCRAVATQLVGFDIDYAFGPMILTRESLPYFLDYDGEYGNKWDSILIPRLRVISAGLNVTFCPITFRNDPRMKRVESGDIEFVQKRLEQFNNVVPALIAEWRKLRP